MLLFAFLATPLGVAATAFAQYDPDLQSSQKTDLWLGYLVAAIFAAILVALTLFPSKRQSEDL